MQKRINKKDIVSMLIISALVAFILFILNDMLRYPLESFRLANYIIISIFIVVCIILSTYLLRKFTHFIGKGVKFYLLLLVLLLFVPIAFIGTLEGIMKEKILIFVKKESTPLIKSINSSTEVIQPAKLKNMAYYKNDTIYMLKIIVPSIDIDGETIFYDSRSKEWHRFHNDMYEYYKNKQDIPESIEKYIWLIKNTKQVKQF